MGVKTLYLCSWFSRIQMLLSIRRLFPQVKLNRKIDHKMKTDSWQLTRNASCSSPLTSHLSLFPHHRHPFGILCPFSSPPEKCLTYGLVGDSDADTCVISVHVAFHHVRVLSHWKSFRAVFPITNPVFQWKPYHGIGLQYIRWLWFKKLVAFWVSHKKYIGRQRLTRLLLKKKPLEKASHVARDP